MLEDILNVFMNGDSLILKLSFFTVLIVVYSIFVYFFYRFLAKKNIISLNLNQYNRYSNPAVMKFFAALFYIIEYIVLLPVMTFFWFGILAIFLLVLSDGMTTEAVLLVSAALVAAVRATIIRLFCTGATAHISEDLSKDLAKMLPFTLLSISITTAAGFFNATNLTARISEIPILFDHVPYYLLFIVGVELTMRVGGFIFSSFGLAKSIKAESSITEEVTATE